MLVLFSVFRPQSWLLTIYFLYLGICQPAVGGGGREKGLLGGEWEVVGATGDDLLAAAFLPAEVDEGPAGHFVGKSLIYKCEMIVNNLEVTNSQVRGTNPYHRAAAFDALAQGVEPQRVATPQVSGGKRSEEGRGAIDGAKPLVHDGQHTIAHRHAGQQQGGTRQRSTLREEDNGGASHEAHEAAVSGGTALEHRLTGPFEQGPQPAAVRQLLPRNELRTGAAKGLTTVCRPGNHLSVAEIKSHSALFQASVEKQSWGFLFFCHGVSVLV